jgi:hypothetical protein
MIDANVIVEPAPGLPIDPMTIPPGQPPGAAPPEVEQGQTPEPAPE